MYNVFTPDQNEIFIFKPTGKCFNRSTREMLS